MSSIHGNLLTLVRRVDAVTTLPVIRTVILPHSTSPSADKYAKFGLLVLDDGSAGFFYRLPDLAEWVELEVSGHLDRLLADLHGKNPATVAELIEAPDPFSRGIGMAATNAISQHVYKRAGMSLSNASRTELHNVDQATHIGMVGYFGPTVAKLRESNVKLTVLELDESLYQESATFAVTGDSSRLTDCSHILCTASTLLNDTLDDLLSAFGDKSCFELVGPTCGCFADPLFERGVNRLGSSTVVDSDNAIRRIRKLDPWGDSVKKYTLTTDNYPGFDWLLDKMMSPQ